jgi:hypothetical protein
MFVSESVWYIDHDTFVTFEKFVRYCGGEFASWITDYFSTALSVDV